MLIGGSRSISAMDKKMQQVHKSITKQFSGVDHLSHSEFNELETEYTIVFDVREKTEFEVSHLANAIQVDPEITTEDFLQQYQEQIGDKTVVFYCSVGQRSSELAERVDEVLNEKEFIEVYNLAGGLFEWHNNGLPMVNDNGETQLIHPYNRKWGKLINNEDSIHYQ